MYFRTLKNAILTALLLLGLILVKEYLGDEAFWAMEIVVAVYVVADGLSFLISEAEERRQNKKSTTVLNPDAPLKLPNQNCCKEVE